MASPNDHASKVLAKQRDHLKHEAMKSAKLPRHSVNGTSLNDGPKKGGRGGKGVWGSFEDDIKDYRTQTEKV